MCTMYLSRDDRKRMKCNARKLGRNKYRTRKERVKEMIPNESELQIIDKRRDKKNKVSDKRFPYQRQSGEK